MEAWKGRIDSAERMLEAIRHYGIVPFFKCGIPGWSIEEMTPAQCWFFSSDQLGPWDWKIDVLQSGDVAYGKYLRRKAAFSTAEFYGHLLNWRRSQQKYIVSADIGAEASATSKKRKALTIDERLNALLAHPALEAIRQAGALESGELRLLLEERVSADMRKSVGGHMEKYLLPKLKKQALEFVLQHLEMGCHVVVGDFRRVYRGPNMDYSGWQRSSLTTPEALFGSEAAENAREADMPFWARFIDDSAAPAKESFIPACSPEESLHFLINHISSFFPGYEKEIARLLA